MYWISVINKNNLKSDLSLVSVFDCVHEWDTDPCEVCCMKCGLIQNFQIYTIDKSCMIEFWPRQYVRTDYYHHLFNKIVGIEKILISDQHREWLVADIPNPGDWYQVYQKFKNWDLQDWWTSWNILCDNPSRIDFHPEHLNLLIYVDAYWKPSLLNNTEEEEKEETMSLTSAVHSTCNYEKRSKKKLNVFYTLYKIVEMTGYDVTWIPLKLRSICIEKLDEEWKEICFKFNWKFIKTKQILQKIYWNKIIIKKEKFQKI